MNDLITIYKIKNKYNKFSMNSDKDLLNILPKVLWNIIAEYATEYSLLNWIPNSQFNQYDLRNQPNLHYWKHYNDENEKPSYINSETVVEPDKINWFMTCQDPTKITFIEENFDQVNWSGLSRNENAIHILEQNIDKIDWAYFSANLNAIHIIEKEIERDPATNNVDWDWLSTNKNAFHILEQNKDKINWNYFSSNENIKAIPLLKKNLSKLNIHRLAINPIAISILKNYPKNDKVWDLIKNNPGILKNNYKIIFNTIIK